MEAKNVFFRFDTDIVAEDETSSMFAETKHAHKHTRAALSFLGLKLVSGFVCFFRLFSFHGLDMLPPVFILLETQKKVYF